MNMMTKDELYNALVAVTNEATGEKLILKKMQGILLTR